MLRKSLATAAIASTLLVGGASMATAEASATTAPKHQLKCVGAAEHKQAQALRLQAAQADLAALRSRRAAAVAAGLTARVVKIDAHTAKVLAHIAKIKAGQDKLSARCP